MGLTTLITTIFSLIKSGKETVDDVLADPDMKNQISNVENAYKNELQYGNLYTKAARPTAIYLCLFIIFNDFILVPYINTFFSLIHPLPYLLSESKFKMLMGFLTALGLARSVLDKQGNWLTQLFTKK